MLILHPPSFPISLCLILSSMFMQNIELKELIRICAEMHDEKRQEYWGCRMCSKQVERLIH